jgi:hypothetical protein
MVDHNVVRLDVAMHYAFAVAVVKGLAVSLASALEQTHLEQLEDVEAHVKVGELGVQAAEVGVIYVFEY